MWQWITNHWELAASVGAVLAVTVITQWITYYGPEHPRVVRFLQFLLSIGSALPTPGGNSVGLRLLIGRVEVQIPGLSATMPPTEAQRAARAAGVKEQP